MKKFIVYTLVFISISFMPQKKTRVIFFGDSITELGAIRSGYVNQIDSLSKTENRSEDFEFISAGISGNKVYDLYLRLESDVISKKTDLVIIYIGVNDIRHKASFGTGTDQDKFETFYQAIINKLKAINSKIILCTPAVIGEKTDFSNQQDGDLNQYNKIIHNIAQKNNLQIVDLRKTFLEYNLKNNPTNKDRGILTADRVHLNAAGNRVVAQEIWKAIKAS